MTKHSAGETCSTALSLPCALCGVSVVVGTVHVRGGVYGGGCIRGVYPGMYTCLHRLYAFTRLRTDLLPRLVTAPCLLFSCYRTVLLLLLPHRVIYYTYARCLNSRLRHGALRHAVTRCAVTFPACFINLCLCVLRLLTGSNGQNR